MREVEKVKGKIISILVMTLLIVATVLPVAGNVKQLVNVVNSNKTQETEFPEFNSITNSPIFSKDTFDFENLELEQIQEINIQINKPNPDPGHIKNVEGSPATGARNH